MFLLLEKFFLVHSEDAEVSWCFHGWRLERFPRVYDVGVVSDTF